MASTASAPRAPIPFSDPTLRRTIIIALCVSVAYYITATIGFEFTLQPGSVSALWLPNTVVLAGLLLTARRWWWLIIAATLPAHLASEFQSGVPAGMVLSWFLSNSFQALFAAISITYFANQGLSFTRLRNLTIFFLCGAFLAPFFASFLDSFLVSLNGWGSKPYWEVWRLRFLSNVLATLIVIPFVVEWSKNDFRSLRQVKKARLLEAFVLFTGLFVIVFVVFYTGVPLGQSPALLYFPLPLLVWATIRFGMRGISSGLLIVMCLSIMGAAQGSGPFVGNDSSYRALSIQAFLIVVTVPLLLLAVVIEERKLTEAAARENEERLMLALNAAQMDTWDWQLSNNDINWSAISNGSLQQQSDFNLTMESFYELVHPGDRPRVETSIANALETGAPYEVEFRLRSHGESHWYLNKGKVFHNDRGKPTRLLGVSIDVTERKQAERDMNDMHARHQAILRAFPDVMFLQNADGVYLDYYTRDPGILLVSPSEFLGKNVRDVLPPELANSVMEAIDQVLQGFEPHVLEYNLPLNNGTRYFEARIVSAEGRRVLSIVRDITEAKRAEEAVRLSEARLRQSTRQIRALAAQLITARESERRRIALLLHDDVGQNVATLGLAISRIKRRPPENTVTLVTELDQISGQISSLTTQIRQLSHELHPEVLEHVGLIAALKSHLKEVEEHEQLRISFASNVTTDPIPQDIAVCLYRVALEAVRNVSLHSGASSADVVLTEQDGFLVLKVSDTGQGFDVERMKHGSGLGLASSEERVKMLSGTLEVRSDSASGTCLTARVPLSNGYD